MPVIVEIEPFLHKWMQLEKKNLIVLHALINYLKITAYLLYVGIAFYIIGMSAEGRHIDAELTSLVAQDFLEEPAVFLVEENRISRIALAENRSPIKFFEVKSSGHFFFHI